MEGPRNVRELGISGFKFLIIGTSFFGIIAGFLYFNVSPNLNFKPVDSTPEIPSTPETETESKAPELYPKPVTTPLVGTSTVATDGIRMLYPTKEGGRVWYAKWVRKIAQTLQSGQRDPLDPEFVARGDGSVYIQGDGTAHLEGDAPRMYVFDPAKGKQWTNVEVTVYAKRISEYGHTSSQGIVIGARSEHQDATEEDPCFGATYYARLLYDGRAVFQKEIIHEGSYSRNKPSENNKTNWNTPDGSLPTNVWVGVKFVVKTNPDQRSVKLELYRDLTEGKDGGAWKKVAGYTDVGDWAQINSGIDVMKVCGYPANKILLDSGTSVFIRNDEVKDVEYKLFSIREIE